MSGDGGGPAPGAAEPDDVGAVDLPGLTVLRQLGRGGTTDVYLARQHDLRRIVAVKVIRTGVDDDTAWRAFVHEAQVVARLGGHRHVLNVYDAGRTAAGRPFLVTEYLDRGSLADVLAADGPLPGAEVARIGVAVVEALAALHQRGMVHGDVRAGNVLLGSKGAVKLADFGMGEADEGPWTDVHDLAATVVHALTGRSDVRSDIGADGPTSPLVPVALGAVLVRALAERPQDRPSLPSLRDALVAVAEGRDPASPSAPARASPDGDLTRLLPASGDDSAPTVALPIGADTAVSPLAPPTPTSAVPAVPVIPPVIPDPAADHTQAVAAVDVTTGDPGPTRVVQVRGPGPAARPVRGHPRRRRVPAVVAVLLVFSGAALASALAIAAWQSRGDGASGPEAAETTLADPGSTTTEVPPSTDPAAFLRDYYATLAAGSYAEAYALLAPEFESVGSFEDYAAFWEGVDGIEVLAVEPVGGGDGWPRRFNLTMRYTIGDRVTTELDELTVRPGDGGRLLISAYRVVTTL